MLELGSGVFKLPCWVKSAYDGTRARRTMRVHGRVHGSEVPTQSTAQHVCVEWWPWSRATYLVERC